MGSYKEVKGDLLAMAKNGDFDIIAHGCNCHKVMGAGIALQIARQFPDACEIDRVDYRAGLSRLGDFTYSYHGFVIFNLYTQFLPGPNLDYTALELCLKKLAIVNNPKEHKIGLPQIGCGIAGGDWEKVKEIIKRVLSEYDVTIVVYEK